MKNILSTLTVLFILLTSSMSWGSIRNKGLLCFVDDEMLGYWFISNQTYEKSIIIRISDNFVIKGEEKKIQTINENEIFLEGLGVNRKTLKVSEWRNGGVKIVGFCDVYSEKYKFYRKMYGIKKQKQRSYDNHSKENKI